MLYMCDSLMRHSLYKMIFEAESRKKICELQLEIKGLESECQKRSDTLQKFYEVRINFAPMFEFIFNRY